MFRITEDPASGSLVQCLAKNYKNDSMYSGKYAAITQTLSMSMDTIESFL